MPGNHSNRYDDIIDLPHPTSSKHPRMSNYDRAAQFSPFAALTGHDAAIAETARLTDCQAILDDSRIEQLNNLLRVLQENEARHPGISVTYFQPDSRKSGGSYLTIRGKVKRVDAVEETLVLLDGTVLPLGDIYEIEVLK